MGSNGNQTQNFWITNRSCWPHDHLAGTNFLRNNEASQLRVQGFNREIGPIKVKLKKFVEKEDEREKDSYEDWKA